MIVFAAVAGLVSGPAFFLFALYTALYGAIPEKTVHTSIARQINSTSRSSQRAPSLPGTKLSSIRASEPDQFDPARVANHETNPLKAYLSLRGLPDNLQLSTVDGVDDHAANANQTYRTVCVRLCDGYYFPIGFNVTPDNFADNEDQCRSRCGSPARLFVYSENGGSPVDMRDLKGNAYLTLKNAFRFHTKYVSQCTCRPQPWTTAARDRHRRYAALAAKQRLKLAAAAAPSSSKVASVSVQSSSIQHSDGINRNQILHDIAPGPAPALPIGDVIASTQLQPAPHAVEGASPNAERLAAINERSTILASIEIEQSLVAAALREKTRRRLAWERSRRKQDQLAALGPADLIAIVAVDQTPPVKKLPKVATVEGTALARQAVADASADEILRRNLLPLY